MKHLMKLLALLFAALPTACGAAGARDSNLPEVEIVEVTGPLSLQITLEGEESEIRLASLDTPDPERTEAFLAGLVTGQSAGLDLVSEDTDRYGRRIGTVWLQSGGERNSVHTLLLEAGLARVYPYPDVEQQLPGWLAAEARARQAARGIWEDRQYRVRDVDPDMLMQDVGTVQIVEGRVTGVAILSNGRTYLNFGSDYRTDFTLRVDAELADDFTRVLGELAELEGHLIRARGVIRDENGPMIIPPFPQRLEIVEE